MSAIRLFEQTRTICPLKVWIGRFRFYQASQDREAELSDDLQALSHRVFHQLKWLSRQYEPGYIEAFRQDFSTDWAVYVKEAQEQLHQAMGTRHRTANATPHTHASPNPNFIPIPEDVSAIPPGTYCRVVESTHATLLSAMTFIHAMAQYQDTAASLVGLKALVVKTRLPNEGLNQFLRTLRKAVADVGTANPELLRLVLPYQDYIKGEKGLCAFAGILSGSNYRKLTSNLMTPTE